jgi:predicted DCC family thiol-disulfide oxidoreductase YuxK
MTPFLHGASRDWERLPVWVIFNRACHFCLLVDVRFIPKADPHFQIVRMNQGVTCVPNGSLAASLSDSPHTRRCNLCPKGKRRPTVFR